jgi:predicted PhzF superfamily epimerase YddE/YHI9
MTAVQVLAVFGDRQDRHLSKVAVVVDGPSVPHTDRARLAAQLGMEISFVDRLSPTTVSVFDSGGRLPIAAQPVLAAAWLLRHLGEPPRWISLPLAPVTVGANDAEAWIGIPLAAVPERVHRQLACAAAVDALTAKSAMPDTYYWAWEDLANGTVRARWFDSTSGIEEFTVAPVLGLAAELGRPIVVRQCGAEVKAESTANDAVVLRGRVRLLEPQSLTQAHDQGSRKA